MTDDVRKLLGGYATGTLSDEEKQLLYDAALNDDKLFAALADEHALKELLDDSTVRAQLLRATEEPKFSLGGAFREWFDRPKAKALVATGAVLLAIIAFNTSRQPVEEKPQQVAEVRIPAQPPPPVVEVPAPRLARKAAKPKVQRDEPAVVQQAPAPAASAAPTTSGGVVGGVVGSAPAVSSLRFKEEASADRMLPFRYELLRKEPDGEFRPVATGYEFAPGDTVRVRITTAQNGAVAVAGAGQDTLSQMVTAGQTISLPATGGIAVTPDIRNLVLTFSAPESTKSVEIPIRHRAP
jgi:hypothetical protein